MNIDDIFQLTQKYKADIVPLKDMTKSKDPWLRYEVASGYAPDFEVRVFDARGYFDLFKKIVDFLNREERKEIALGGGGH